ncbi:MAG: MraY family glycosyltransferase [Janthinobacterium lividum]
MDFLASPIGRALPRDAWPLAYAAIFVCAAGVCAAILWLLLKTGWAWSLATDVPNHRSLHTRPTPRVGGWGIVPVALLGMLLWAPGLRGVAAPALCLALVSQIDDRRGLPARVRFIAHLLAAAWLAYWASLPVWLVPFIVLTLVWAMNLYNFMDGVDGLAGGMALFGFGSFALAALPGGMPLAAACFVLSGAAVGFLAFNFPPARLFLGDAGSVPLGFLAGALGLAGWRAGVWDAVFPFVVFSPFLADASVTLLQRLLRGERFWEAHREHYYQRMIRMAWGRRRVLALWYASMFVAAALALSLPAMSAAGETIAVLAWALALVAAGVTVNRRWKKFCEASA